MTAEPVAALEYHRVTSYLPGALGLDDPRKVIGYIPLQLDRFPPQVKAYPGLPSAPVPAELADLLFFSAGTMRVAEGTRVGTMLFRAAGSAGNLSPIELYVLHESRVLHYDPRQHAVTPIARCGDGPTTIVVTGIPWRTGWKYTERGFRHLYWDAGTMLSQLLALAGPSARLMMGFADHVVADLVGADGTHEFPLAVVVIGDGRPPLTPVDGQRTTEGLIAESPVHFPLVTGAQRSGDLADEAAVDEWRRREPPGGQGVDLTFGAELTEVIRSRGSTRRFDADVTGPRALLVDAFEQATAPLPADFVAEGETLLDHYVLVHAVEGYRPGKYQWTGRGFELLLARDDTRQMGLNLTVNQALGGSGCYTAFHSANLDAVTRRLGDRGYRAALLEAGVVEGRLHLTSYALGYGATGLTYYDYEVRTAFGTKSFPLLVTAVGKPAYKSRPGGTPGYPTVLRK